MQVRAHLKKRVTSSSRAGGERPQSRVPTEGRIAVSVSCAPTYQMCSRFHSMISDFTDFTEEEYHRLLVAAREQWRFVSFREALAGAPGCLWRHDVDFSVHRALRLATLEAQAGVRATYFILLHSPFYNALEPAVATRIRRIHELGHDIGLHMDSSAYTGRIRSSADLDGPVSLEKRIVEEFFMLRVDSFSFHNPTVDPAAFSESDEVAGLINAYGRSIQDRFAYISDSNGYWRHQQLRAVIESRRTERIQVLTHPEWWTPEPMSPRDRVSRCIEGRARRQHQDYDDFLALHSRLNVR